MPPAGRPGATGAYVWIAHEPEAIAHRAAVILAAAPIGAFNGHRFRRG